MASADPLLLLRGALSSGRPISLLAADGAEVFDLKDCADISFGAGRAFPKTAPTRFLAAPSSSVDDPALPTYDLQTLLLAFNEKDTPFGQYIRNAGAAGVAFVSGTDRRVVIDYLRGSGPVEGPEDRVRPLPGAAKRSADDEAGGAAPGEAGAAAGAAPPQKKQRYVPNRDDQDKVKRMLQIIEGPLYGHVVGPDETKLEKSGGAYHNRETVLRGERINNFDSVRTLVGPRLKALKDDPARKQAAQQAAPAQKVPQKKKQLNPIIMISPSSTALITMHNVKAFLEEARFVPSEEARRIAAMENTNSANVVEDVVLVNHARASTSSAPGTETRKARYFVVDSVEALSKFGGGKLDEAWERVVCVMTTGQEWQFKPYKWKEPKELFHHVKGVYPQWTTDPPNPKVKSWNVSELRIDPSKRHTDKSTVADFWRTLEGWIGQNKPWVSY
ncbi:accessory factor associated with RNA polymerase II [Rhodotorula kratochvilovae]